MQQGLLACGHACDSLGAGSSGCVVVPQVQGHLACNKLCERSHVVVKTKNYTA